MIKWTKEIIERIKDRRRRKRYLENLIRLGLRYQLRSLRDKEGLTQGKLAEMVGTKQSVISRLENNPERVSLPTLLGIADALDVGVIVRFESIDKVIEWYENLTEEKIIPKSTTDILSELDRQSNLYEFPTSYDGETVLNSILDNSNQTQPELTNLGIVEAPKLSDKDNTKAVITDSNNLLYGT